MLTPTQNTRQAHSLGDVAEDGKWRRLGATASQAARTEETMYRRLRNSLYLWMGFLAVMVTWGLML